MDLSNFYQNKDCQKILKILNNNNETSRIVGGYVRDYLRNIETKDIDIATKLNPNEVIELLSKEKIKTVPTGLSHGTVSAFINDQIFEITTLRKDSNHDGRHANIEFTEDWEEDASRRDFTINAIYMDYNGEIYDPFDGISDLNNGVVKFIGDPEKRIKEDYLRILRYYRFLTIYNSSIDNKTKADRAISILSLVGIAIIPIIKKSVDWWQTLHQPSTFTLTSAPSMTPDMYMPLLVCVLGFYLIFGLLLTINLRAEVLMREKNKSWVLKEFSDIER